MEAEEVSENINESATENVIKGTIKNSLSHKDRKVSNPFIYYKSASVKQTSITRPTSQL